MENNDLLRHFYTWRKEMEDNDLLVIHDVLNIHIW